jgi:uncharacterized protein
MTVIAKVSAAAALAVLVLIVAFALGSAGRTTVVPAAAAGTTPNSPPPGIEVSGVGELTGTPDVLRLDMGVEARAGSVDAALHKANAAMAKVIRALRGRGVNTKDVRAAGLSVNPDYTYDGSPPRITGYVATETLNATLRDLDAAGGVASAAVAAGGDAARVDGLRLDLEGDSDLLVQARKRAFDDAKAKASTYAEAAGRTLGAVLRVSEQVDRAGPEPMAYRTMGAADSASVPVEPGSQRVSVSVTVVWSFA